MLCMIYLVKYIIENIVFLKGNLLRDYSTKQNHQKF